MSTNSAQQIHTSNNDQNIQAKLVTLQRLRLLINNGKDEYLRNE